MLTVVAVALGIPVAGAMMVFAVVSLLGRRGREGRAGSRYPSHSGNSADAGSTSGGVTGR